MLGIGLGLQKGGVLGAGFLLNEFSGAAAGYSLRKLSSSTTNVIRVRRSSDNAEDDFTPIEITNSTLINWVNGVNNEVMDNPDITSATGWTIGGSTSYNAGTEAFDLSGETGLTIRQNSSVEGIEYEVTVTISNYSSGSVRVYAGGNNSANLSSNGTHVVTIIGGSSNAIVGINPTSATMSIDSFSAIQKTANGHVTTLYDQSGNSRDAVQATAGEQPKIVNAGVLNTKNGKPSVVFDGVDDTLIAPGIGTGITGLFVSTVASFNNTGLSNSPIFATGDTGAYGSANEWVILRQISGIDRLSINNKTTITKNSGSTSDTSQSLFSFGYDTAEQFLYKNNALVNTVANAGLSLDLSNDVSIASYDSIAAGDITFQELIIYASDQSSNRTAIEDNINKGYNIY